MGERTLVAHWEGPFAWDTISKQFAPEHVIYALFGAHHLYGRDVLLYLGKAETGAVKRVPDHRSWINDEYDEVSVRLASVGDFKGWDDWKDGERYPRADADTTHGVEALLILAHQPAYNLSGKGSTTLAKGLRILNTGRVGHLLPEVSSLYHLGA